MPEPNLKYKRIWVTKAQHDRLMKDCEYFKKSIGGGEWSIMDTLSEWIKILDGL